MGRDLAMGILSISALLAGGVLIALSLSHWWLLAYTLAVFALLIFNSRRRIEHAKSLGRSQAFDGAEGFVERWIRLRDNG